MTQVDYDPNTTKDGHLPPWEVAKAYGIHVALRTISEHIGESPSELLGQRVDKFIASQLQLKGGGNPTERAVRETLKKCANTYWYPGKVVQYSGGRPPIFTEFQKQEVARVAMDMKRKLIAPTPRRVRARLPQTARNPETGGAMSVKSIQRIFSTLCYDEVEDDPWIYLKSPAQDILPSEIKPFRVKCAQWILQHTSKQSWYGHVAIDPCYSLLPRSLAKQEELKVLAMGSCKWMSKKSSRKGPNLRAPSTARTQSGPVSTQVHWTPVFARGKVHIFVLDPAEAVDDPGYPVKLNDSEPRFINLHFGRFLLTVYLILTCCFAIDH